MHSGDSPEEIDASEEEELRTPDVFGLIERGLTQAEEEFGDDEFLKCVEN